MCVEELWVAVCDERWNNNHADVVCRQLGHSGSKPTKVALIMNNYGLYIHTASYLLHEHEDHQHSLFLAPYDLSCIGNEEGLSDCSYKGKFKAIQTCRPGIKGAAVLCTSEFVCLFRNTLVMALFCTSLRFNMREWCSPDCWW